MCIILPVSHIPCTHTIAIWQHCIEATQSGPDGPKPCWNVQQHERGIITRNPCSNCGGQRFFARRGGVAERGNGSPITTPEPDARSTNDDDADDSGYHSDVIHEEEEDSDCSASPLSPRTTRHRKRSSSNHRPLTHKHSWKPNLKRDLSLENEVSAQRRRDSIDSLLSAFDDMFHAKGGPVDAKMVSKSPSPKPQASTPTSPPPVETTHCAQTAQSFPFPPVITIPSPPRPRKNSTLLHPSSPPTTRPQLTRRPSSLLHPSRADQGPVGAVHRTVLSVPPRTNTAPVATLKKMPLLVTAKSEPGKRRRGSVLHSCLSDDEEGDGGRERRDGDEVGERAGEYEYEVEGEILERAAWAAREGRRGGVWR